MTVIWLSEILLVLTLPVGALLVLSHRERADYPLRLVCGIILILAVCLFHRMAERRQRRRQPELIWLPWRKRIWLIVIPLLVFAPLGVLCGITYGSPTTDPVIEENTHLIMDFLYWVISFSTVILIRIIDSCFSHWAPTAPAPGSKSAWRIWISEILLVLLIPVCVNRILFCRWTGDYYPLLFDGRFWILFAVCLFRWLTERRQRRERPELIWLPWRKRIWLTLIPLLICAPSCLCFGLCSYDMDAVPLPGKIARLVVFAGPLFWLSAYTTVVLVRILDNRFSHRKRVRPSASPQDAGTGGA